MSAKTMRYVAGLTSILIASTTFAQNNYAIGPVESSSSKNDVVVLGQRFVVDSSTRCVVRARVVSKGTCTAALSRDAYVVVEGSALARDRAAAITVLPYPYVPGASTVMIGGNLSSLSSQVGQFQIGSLWINDTALLAGGPIDLVAGQYVEISGIQPLAGSLVLAGGIRFATSTISSDGSLTTRIAEVVASQTITGTGIQTATDSGTQTITGTGIQAITGNSSQTITGTGAQTITGTGAQTITGTGAQTITGTGAQTITGTGAQTITGTGAQTITGTGAQTITGTGAQTITGTGAQTITGTGAQTITGTGAQTITGTGAQTITGTGVAAQTITGTGR